LHEDKIFLSALATLLIFVVVDRLMLRFARISSDAFSDDSLLLSSLRSHWLLYILGVLLVAALGRMRLLSTTWADVGSSQFCGKTEANSNEPNPFSGSSGRPNEVPWRSPGFMTPRAENTKKGQFAGCPLTFQLMRSSESEDPMGFMDTVKSWFGTAKDVAGDAAEKAADVAGDAAHKAKDVAGDAAHKAKDVVDDVKGKLDGDSDAGDVVADAANSATDVVADAADSATDAAGDAADAVDDAT
jgi:hypothetical protein